MSEMTLETFIKRLKRLGKGEHYCGDLEKIYLKTAKKVNMKSHTSEKEEQKIS